VGRCEVGAELRFGSVGAAGGMIGGSLPSAAACGERRTGRAGPADGLHRWVGWRAEMRRAGGAKESGELRKTSYDKPHCGAGLSGRRAEGQRSHRLRTPRATDGLS
jgi:hypothetical protein